MVELRGKRIGLDVGLIIQRPWKTKPSALESRSQHVIKRRTREINDLEPVGRVKQEVLGLDIAVDNAVGMKKMQSFCGIVSPLESLHNSDARGCSLKMLSQVTPGHVL
jgi:hypothetical protein